MKRIPYLDYLRIVSVFAVVILHVSAASFHSTGGVDFEWFGLSFYNSIVRWGVPVFTMISGALFLSRTVETKAIYKKYIPRMVVAFFTWSLVYVLSEPVLAAIRGEVYNFSIPSVVGSFLSGQYHMWYIPMIIGIYMFLPVIEPIAKNEKIRRYFLLMSVIFICIMPLLKNISQDFSSGVVRKFADVIVSLFEDMNIVIRYPFYFVLGYELSVTTFSKKQKSVIYVLGGIGFISTILLNIAAAIKTNSPGSYYNDNFLLNILFQAIFVFVVFKNIKVKNEKPNAFVMQLSDSCFGAYLIHLLIMRIFGAAGITAVSYTSVACTPVLSLVIFVLSFVVAFAIKKIPFINKWIV